jgi:hypothetical protein
MPTCLLTFALLGVFAPGIGSDRDTAPPPTLDFDPADAQSEVDAEATQSTNRTTPGRILLPALASVSWIAPASTLIGASVFLASGAASTAVWGGEPPIPDGLWAVVVFASPWPGTLITLASAFCALTLTANATDAFVIALAGAGVGAAILLLELAASAGLYLYVSYEAERAGIAPTAGVPGVLREAAIAAGTMLYLGMPLVVGFGAVMVAAGLEIAQGDAE